VRDSAASLSRKLSVKAIISDFGGVLTTPLLGSFMALQDEIGIEPGTLGQAMQRIAERQGEHPLFELERGRISEADFLDALSRELEPELGSRPQLQRFSEIYFDALQVNEPMIGVMRDAKGRGLRTALLTNNIREWEPLWRAMLPVDKIFDVVVDSAFVGMRKPEHEIYELTVEWLGDGIGPANCLFVDDVEVNVEAARDLGMRTVHFQSNEQAIPEIEAALEDKTPT
jgi:putative hydrolase of the HAD superfamily